MWGGNGMAFIDNNKSCFTTNPPANDVRLLDS